MTGLFGRRASRVAPFCVLAVLGVAGCSKDLPSEVTSGIQQQTTAAAPAGVRPEVWADVHRFYEQRAFMPRWVRDGRAEDAVTALAVLLAAPEHGLAASDYDGPELSGALSDTRAIKEVLGK